MVKIPAIIVKAYNFIFLYILKKYPNFLPRTNDFSNFDIFFRRKKNHDLHQKTIMIYNNKSMTK